MAALRIGAAEPIRRHRPPRARLRVQEVGSGPPVLFIHGTVGPGPGRHLIAGMPGFAHLVLDRPGWGLSTRSSIRRGGYRAYVADLWPGCSMGSASTGSTWSADPSATSGRSALPSTIRTVSAGSCSLAADRSSPRCQSRASSGACLADRRPHGPTAPESRPLRSILRENGHGASLEDGRVADEFFEWRLSLANDTPSMRHERDMVRGFRGSDLVSGRASYSGSRSRRARPSDAARLRDGRPDRQRRTSGGA